ncbi:hypothetical protein [Paludibacterium denitrificans]|uniref:Uncharacterized protein n=1 Tax=Paludibacterium denitrificans TaxID=2675226 RepID=A0A844GGY4_9NEIS|nr:hypothetical protein [Paludibacterium denitrificans]MTD33765.1 hypothetical protein [Paludibacterium denitrificans]
MSFRIPLSVRRKQARDQHESFLYAVAKPQLSNAERCLSNNACANALTTGMMHASSAERCADDLP